MSSKHDYLIYQILESKQFFTNSTSISSRKWFKIIKFILL
jgi:hypothetical protein